MLRAEEHFIQLLGKSIDLIATKKYIEKIKFLSHLYCVPILDELLIQPFVI